MRSFSISLILGSLVLLAACGGGTPSGVPITLSVTASPTTINPGQSSTLTASVVNSSNTGVTWSIASPAGFGTLSSTTANPVTYTAPTSVSKTTLVTIMATAAASSSVTATAQITVQSSAGTIALSPGAPQTINVAEALPITATLNNTGSTSVSWASSNSNIASLSSTSGSPVTLTGKAAGSVTVTATSGMATQTLEVTVLTSGAGPNVAALTVGTGPVAYANGVLTSVQICATGSTTNCTTVDSVLVDTGSVGLRILATAIPNIALTPVTYSDGSALNECVQFLDGSFLWGTVSQATINIGGEAATGLPVQVIANPTGFSIPTACSNGGTNEDTQATLSANGIIGVGPEPFDCGLACDVNGGLSAPPAPVYYASCSSASGCQPVFASCGSECQDSTADQQVTNPVIGFGTDNNGTVIAMTPPAGGAAPTATGTLTFGIGTETNNALTAANILTLNQSDEFETAFEGQDLFASFIDSGSNALFFPNWPSLTICSDNPDFYCPSSPAALSAVNIGTNNFQSAVNFTVDNADTLFSNSGAQAFNNLAGPEQAGSSPATCVNNNGTLSGDCTFDFGFTFFYGNTIFTSIDGQSVPATAPTPPWFAY